MLNIKSLLKPKRITVNEVIKNPQSTDLELDKWIVSDFVVNKLHPIVANRPFPLDEQMLLVSAILLSSPDYIFDWGTHIGKSARIFYETTQYFGIESEIHSMDLPDDEEHVEHPGEKRGRLVKDKENVYLHQSDGVDTALKICKAKKAKRPFFYVDGDHSYESVHRELTALLTSIKNPTIVLHDTFYQSKDSGYNIGPSMAIKDVLKSSRSKPRIITTQLGLPGMTLLLFNKPKRTR